MKTRALIVSSLLGLLTLNVLAAVGCEPSLTLHVDNQTDQTLFIAVDGNQCFDALPKTVTKGETGVLATLSRHFVEGVNKSGDVVFARYFSRAEQQDTTLKVTIQPTEENPYSPLEFENTTPDRIGIYIDQAFIGWVEAGTTIKKRLLPTNVPAYAIQVYSQTVSYTGFVTHLGQAKKIIDNTFRREQLEKDGWKIVVATP